MVIKTYTTHFISCDNDRCESYYSTGHDCMSTPPLTQKEFYKLMRNNGWSIGKRVLCPDCRNIKPSEVKDV